MACCGPQIYKKQHPASLLNLLLSDAFFCGLLGGWTTKDMFLLRYAHSKRHSRFSRLHQPAIRPTYYLCRVSFLSRSLSPLSPPPSHQIEKPLPV